MFKMLLHPDAPAAGTPAAAPAAAPAAPAAPAAAAPAAPAAPHVTAPAAPPAATAPPVAPTKPAKPKYPVISDRSALAGCLFASAEDQPVAQFGDKIGTLHRVQRADETGMNFDVTVKLLKTGEFTTIQMSFTS